MRSLFFNAFVLLDKMGKENYKQDRREGSEGGKGEENKEETDKGTPY